MDKRMKRVLTFSDHHDASVGSEKRLKTPISDQNSSENNCRRKTNDEYIVGWICAIPTEYVAAQAILDEVHERPEKVFQANQSDYTLGRIGDHNIVIAVLPYGDYGTASAATVARDMSYNFPNIKIRLMVGIGGGAPSQKHDIRLGDIVVSAPADGKSGVLQYDFGKTVQGQPFQMTRMLDQPPMVLRTAINGLISQYEKEGHRLEETINIILAGNPRLQEKYGRPQESSDRLYHSTFVHPINSALDCEQRCDENLLIRRPRRTPENNIPAIHYGLIASANQVMKDAITRDKLSSKYDILCFEMEAGGLMNHFPCLVIRGICDYSDSHKNKAWQGYAAMTAAVYAKDLINRLSPIDFGAPQGTSNSSSQPQMNEILHHPVSAEQRRALLESLRFDQLDARQMTIKKAHNKTCRWLLHKPEYLDWLCAPKFEEHNGFLWIKGKPGTGKSTLMKFALHDAQKTMRDKVIINFFFNARGDDLEKSTIGMYRSLLLQLLEKIPALQHKIESPGITSLHGGEYHWNTEILANLLDQAIQNLGKSTVVCFIDALDECDEDQIRSMIKFFEGVGESAIAGNFYICFSSRHYPHISISKALHLVLEGQEGHTTDMISYITSELKIGNSDLANQIRTKLQEKASGVFMWVVLVVNILNKEYDKGGILDLRKRLEKIPGDLHNLFRDILTRDQHDANKLLLCIQWVLFTKQPLRPEQLYFAMQSSILYEWNHKEITVLDMKRFILNSSKGLTEVTESKTPTVQFIHESVKDYLMKENGLEDIWPDLKLNALSADVLNATVCGESHERLKQCCLNYINLGKTAYAKISDSSTKASSQEAKEQRQSAKSSFPFLEYAVTNVLHHSNAAKANGVNQADFLATFKEKMMVDWVQLDNFFEKHDIRRHRQNVSILYILAEYDMGHLIRCCPTKLDSFRNVESERYGTPIFAALATDSRKSLRALLDAYVELDSSFHDLIEDYYRYGIKQNNLGRTFQFSKKLGARTFIMKGAILFAAFYLRLNGVNVDLDEYSQMFLRSIYADQTSIVKLFLGHGALFNGAQDIYELVSTAIVNQDVPILQLLFDRGANIDYQGEDGRTPLFIAVEKGYSSIIELLLKYGANIDHQEKDGRTPLFIAVEKGYSSITEFLLKHGAKVDTKDDNDRTPLSIAVEKDDRSNVECLLTWGAKVDAKDHRALALLFSNTPNRNENILRLALENFVNINFTDIGGRMLLSYAAAAYKGDATVRLLLEKGAEIDTKDNYSRTLLLYAAVTTYQGEAIVRLLLKKGIEINAKDNNGRTPLSHAAETYKGEATVRLLLEKGTEIDAKDKNGRTPLSYAVTKAYKGEGTVRLLLEKGAEINTKDNGGRTPLSYAATKAYNGEATVKLLLEKGAEIDAKDNNGRTPLSYAAETCGGEATVRLLLEKGAEIDANDNNGRTPLSYTATKAYKGEGTVRLLLEEVTETDTKETPL